MSKLIKLTILLIAILCSITAKATSDLLNDVQVDVRVGYNLGGTTPLNMPASIRKLNSYHLQFAPTIGLMAYKPLKDKWGLTTGLYFENKGMHEDATVKNYRMTMVRGTEKLQGVFIGSVTTKVRQWMFTLPVQLTYPVNKVLLKFGPYASYITSQYFRGWAHDGYLRVDNPTGQKVEIGNDVSSRGDYDFSDDLRRWQVGISLDAVWRIRNRFGIYGSVAWGLTPVHQSDFHTIEQKLYPIYTSIGFTYHIK